MLPIYIISSILLIIIIILCVIVYKVFKSEKKIISEFSEKFPDFKHTPITPNKSPNKCKYFGCNNEACGFGLIPEACKSCTKGIIISSNT